MFADPEDTRYADEIAKALEANSPHKHCVPSFKFSHYFDHWEVVVNGNDMTYNFLKALSAIFGTDDINMSYSYERGCDTCDYGCIKEVTITIKDKG